MFQYLKNLLPQWPDYVMRDWIYNFAKGNGEDFRNVKQNLTKMLDAEGLHVHSQWKLVPNMHFTSAMWNPWTLDKFKQRAGGSQNPMGVKNDGQRHATQAVLAQQQGGIRSEPVIIIKKSDGWELVEGWHRTIQHMNMYPNGYSAPAWTVVSQR